MGTVRFVDRKYESEIDFYFFVKDGPKSLDLAKFHSGDMVKILFEISADQAIAINELLSSTVQAVSDHTNKKWSVNLGFQVIEHQHELAFKDKVITELSHTVSLKADSGFEEDILRWIFQGEKPRWANKEQ